MRAIVVAIVLAGCISKPARKAPGDGGADGDGDVDARVYKPQSWKVHTDFDHDLGNYAGVRLAYDPPHHEVVLYDDDLDQIWHLRTDGWKPRDTIPVSATKRADPAFAFDPVENKLRLFGGSDVPGSYLDDEYVFDPDIPVWQKQTTLHVPAQRNQAMIVAGNDRVFLVGGYNGGALPDIDERVAGDWEPRRLADNGNTAFASQGMSVTWDADHDNGSGLPRGRILALEGLASSTSGELHAYDITNDRWFCIVCDGPRRHGASLVHLPGRNLTLLIGGDDDSTMPVAGTLQLVDDDAIHGHWIPFGDPLMPPGRTAAGLAYDEARDALILYGGSGSGTECVSGVCGDTYELSPDG